jgi:hypothetical protein
MYIKSLLSIGALLLGMVTAGALSADTQRSPSPAGATVGFANLADGDVVPPGFIARFTISGMEIAPAGSKIPNTGHFHLLINLDELPPMDQPLPATDQIVHFGKGQTETALQLPDGKYRLQLLLADYAHVPHDPPVMSDVITITVSSAATMPDES